MTAIRKAIDDTWGGKARYRNGRSFGRRDIIPTACVLALCALAWFFHDVSSLRLPLPSSETMLFIGFLLGLLRARRFRP